MSTDASKKLIGLRICQEFCRMFPTGHGQMNPVEMSPFLMTMRLIKQFYGFSKPEVYSTLTALLQDYDPSLGVKHRERTMRYIRLLLVDQPDLADYLLYLLPESVKSNDDEGLQQQQQPSKCTHCSAQTVRCEKRTAAESVREEPINTSSLLQRMVVLPASESFQDFTSTAVRIAPAMNSMAGISTSANSVLTLGQSSKLALPHLVKNATRQVKQVQIQNKPTMLSTLLYSPNIVIKSELLTDASSIVTLPRISSTVAATSTPITAVQDASNPLARNLGLKLATHINALPKYGTDKASSASGKAPLLRTTAPRTVFESSCSKYSRTSDVSLDNRLENIIKKFGKDAQTSSAVRVTSVHQRTAEKSLVPSSFFYPKLSCVRNNDPKETIVVQKQPEFFGRSTHTSVANGLVRCMSTFSQSQPMFLIEKSKGNATTSSFDSAGIRIIKKSKVSAGGLPLTRFEKLPTTVAETSPLISLKKLVAGVGLLKSFDSEADSRSSAVISNRDVVLDSGTSEKTAACDQSQGESVDGAGSDVTKGPDHQGATSSSKSLLDHENVEADAKHPENETILSVDSFRPVLENSFDKEVCNPSGSVESEERLSPYSDETSRSLLLNDGTSDYHVSDEEQVLPDVGSIKPEPNGSKCSPSGGSSKRNATSALGFDAQSSIEEPLCKKPRVATSTDNNSKYQGGTYLARLMELPSPPSYGHDYPWDLVTEDRKRKGKIAIKRKRKK